MADFWGSMTSGFNRGVPLGVRSAERAEDQRIRKEERAEDTTYRNEMLGIRKDEAARQKEEYDYQKVQRDKTDRQKNFRKEVVMSKALESAGFNEEAAAKATKAYNDFVNGDQAIMIPKPGEGISVEANGPDGKSPWSLPEAKGANVLVLSKSNGLMPFKSTKDVLKLLDRLSDPEAFDAYEKAQIDKAEARNAAEKPFISDDGKAYIREHTVGKNGIETKTVPYSERMPERKLESKVLKPGEVWQDEKGRVLGEGKGGKVEEYTKNLKAMTDTYKHLGSAIMGKAAEEDFLGPAGQPTDEANTAYKKAISILMKAEKDPKSLTPMEAKMLPIAGNMVKFYQDSLTYIGENRESLFGKKQPSGKQGLTNAPPKGEQKIAPPKPKEKPISKTKKPGLTPPEKPITVASRDNGMSEKAVEALGNSLGINKKGESSIPKILGTGSKKARSQSAEDKAKLMERGAKVKQGISKAAEKAMEIFESENPLHYKLRKLGYDGTGISIMATALRSKYRGKSDEDIAKLIGK